MPGNRLDRWLIAAVFVGLSVLPSSFAQQLCARKCWNIKEFAYKGTWTAQWAFQTLEIKDCLPCKHEACENTLCVDTRDPDGNFCDIVDIDDQIYYGWDDGTLACPPFPGVGKNCGYYMEAKAKGTKDDGYPLNPLFQCVTKPK